MTRKYRGDIDALRAALCLDDTPVPDHRHKIARIGQQTPHQIVPVEDSADDITCLPYALRIAGDETYEHIRLATYGSSFEIFAGRDFAEWLLRGRHLSTRRDPKWDSLVFYFAGSDWKHAGVIAEATTLTVMSKWGRFPVYRHPLFEVPSSYGNEVRFYDPLSEPLKMFVAYASEHGYEVPPKPKPGPCASCSEIRSLRTLD